jgi:hypothetical protein
MFSPSSGSKSKPSKHNIIIVFLDIILRPVSFKTHKVSETGFCLRLHVGPTQLCLVDRASPYLQTIDWVHCE